MTLPYTCYELDRPVRMTIYRNGHALTLGQIVDLLNELHRDADPPPVQEVPTRVAATVGMKFYLAARYSHRDQLRQLRAKLLALGHTVTSRWLDTEWPNDERGSAAAPPEYRAEFAIKDMDDVHAADIVVSLTEPERSGRGGRHVEFGLGLAWRKLLVIIGPVEHIFHHHPSVLHFGSTEEMLRELEVGERFEPDMPTMTDGRSPKELQADGDDYWPDGTRYIPPHLEKPKESPPCPES